MFTGIIEKLGKVKSLQKRGGSFRLKIHAQDFFNNLKIGDSVSVNGACLTIVAKTKDDADFDLLKETAQKTNISKLRIGEILNLESALKVGDRLSGHFVNGHIDCIGIVLNKIFEDGNYKFIIRFPTQFRKYLVLKGSIAVEGISLTVAEIKADTFSIFIIPHTLTNTNLKFKEPSSLVNLEFDILLKRTD
ncbi:MAG: riboflavin synthase [Candidatus Omnitrophota bacterium]